MAPRGAVGTIRFSNPRAHSRAVMRSDPVLRAIDRQGSEIVREFKRNATVRTGQYRHNVRKVRATGYDGRPVVRVEIYDSPNEINWRGSAARSIEFGTNDTPAHLALTRALNAAEGRRVRGGLARGRAGRGSVV